jgi:aryl-alcohol dehydrogenase-like predicted oxidoreductase
MSSQRITQLAAHLATASPAVVAAASLPASKIPTVHCARLGYDFPVVGLGGFGFTKYVGGEGASPEDRARLCSEAVVRALAMGCTYIDVAPGYGGGEAERLLGPALAPHREQFFLGCKTGAFRQSTQAAVAEMENSLAVLQTGYFDLFQFHAVTTEADVDKILGEGGALEAVQAARAAGKVRAIGFSAHDEAAALRLIRSEQFDSVMKGAQSPFHLITSSHQLVSPHHPLVVHPLAITRSCSR